MSDHNGYFEAGQAIGRELLSEAANAATPKQKAETFVHGIVATHPRIKAPVILQNEKVKLWMSEHRVTPGHVREALTRARQKARAEPQEPVVQRPKKKRLLGQAREVHHTPSSGRPQDSEAQSSGASRSGRHAARIVPDKPIGEIMPEGRHAPADQRRS